MGGDIFRESYADAAECAAMKRVLHGEDAVLGAGLSGRVRGSAGAKAASSGAVGSFRATVGEEDATHAGDSGACALAWPWYAL